MPRLHRVLLPLCVIAAVCLSQIGAAAAADQPPPPEVAILSLLPYVMTTADLPTGFVARPPSYSTASGRALGDTASSGDPHQEYATLAREGLIVWTMQQLADGTVPGVPQAFLESYAMADAYRARDRTDGRLTGPVSESGQRVDDIALAMTFGDATSARHFAATSAAGVSTGGYEIRWQHGTVSLEVYTRAPYGSEQLSDAVALVQAVARRAAAHPAPVAPAGITAPASEDQRIDAALALETIRIPQSALPSGFHETRLALYSTAGFVFSDSDPLYTLTLYDRDLQRIYEIGRAYQTAAGTDGPLLEFHQFLDTDADHAAGDIATGASVLAEFAVPPPEALGDQILAVRIPQRDGTVTAEVFWTHGAVMLNVDVTGPPSFVTDDFVAAFMDAAEAAYQASVFAAQ